MFRNRLEPVNPVRELARGIKPRARIEPSNPAASRGAFSNGVNKEELGLRREFKERTYGYLTAALGLVAGLAWNEAIKSLIDYWLPLRDGAGGVLLKFIYAFVITALVVVFTYYTGKYFKNNNGEKN